MSDLSSSTVWVECSTGPPRSTLISQPLKASATSAASIAFMIFIYESGGKNVPLSNAPVIRAPGLNRFFDLLGCKISGKRFFDQRGQFCVRRKPQRHQLAFG